MTAFYNETGPFAAAWLRELIKAGRIAPGVVDERSIEDITPAELAGYTQCHFFAGIGGWSYALRLAGWPDDKPVWTGSCPCQPFSQAGKGGGFADERHLWPAWYHLIQQCRPLAIFGEQVASSDGLAWLDLVSADLEGSDYAVGSSDLCAAGVGAPHIRQRLYWLAVSNSHGQHAGGEGCSALGHREAAESDRGPGGLGDAMPTGLPFCQPVGMEGAGGGYEGRAVEQSGEAPRPWSCEWLGCRDGKLRPVEPGTFPLAYGIPSRVERRRRVGSLRGYGNAIVPQVAAAFIKATGLVVA